MASDLLRDSARCQAGKPSGDLRVVGADPTLNLSSKASGGNPLMCVSPERLAAVPLRSTRDSSY